MTERAGKRAAAPLPRAVALTYDDQRPAPEVVARGGGVVAEGILALASQHGIPVREDPDLVELLSACDVGEEIPVALYAAVAELLAYLYQLNEDARAD